MKRKLKLKKNIKEGIMMFGLVIVLTALFTTFLYIYTIRIDNIRNNQDGYTKNGRAHAVNVQLVR
jgi:hypothetical protein